MEIKAMVNLLTGLASEIYQMLFVLSIVVIIVTIIDVIIFIRSFFSAERGNIYESVLFKGKNKIFILLAITIFFSYLF